MGKISNLDYNGVPGIKDSAKLFIKALLRKFYVMPREEMGKRRFEKEIEEVSKDSEVIILDGGISGVFIVASYTDKDKEYLPGMIESVKDVFSGIVLYHDLNKKHNFNYNESARFQGLIKVAKDSGAKWVLVGSPKTRFSKEFRSQIEGYFSEFEDTKTVLGLKERYLWGDFSHYAFPSNIVGDHYILKFFAITDNMEFDDLPIHAAQRPINYDNIIETPASRLYLGRINIDIMRRKAEFYHKKDGGDYSYLYDMGEVKEHGEEVLGIGDFERKELLGEE